MPDLTDKEKAECQQVINTLINYWWRKVEIKVNNGLSFEGAVEELLEEILNA